MKHLFFFFLSIAQVTFASSIYDYIKPIPFDNHGWFQNKPQLERIFEENEIESVIELGSWAGTSTRYFGEKLRGKGVVLAVDTWLGSQNEEAHLKDPRIAYLYQLFLSNVKHAGLEEVIIPFKMTTDEAAVAIEFKADLIYVDGDHSTRQVVRDIINWNSHLSSRGILCGDDWQWGTVRKGVEQAAKQLGRQIEAEGNFWRLR